jgi:hypothetical protein
MNSYPVNDKTLMLLFGIMVSIVLCFVFGVTGIKFAFFSLAYLMIGFWDMVMNNKSIIPFVSNGLIGLLFFILAVGCFKLYCICKKELYKHRLQDKQGAQDNMRMDSVEKILSSIGLRMNDIHSLNQTDALILCRVFDAIQDFAMYNDKNHDLEMQCKEIKATIREQLNQGVIK